MTPGFLKKIFGGGDDDGGSPSRPAAERGFRERADAFWEWFAAHDAALFDGLRSGSLDVAALADAVRSAAPQLAWELCPADGDGVEGFAVSGEAGVGARLLARYLVGRAPALERWTFFASKQPTPGIAGATVEIGTDEQFAFADFRFSVGFDEDAQRLEIEAFHPRFGALPENARHQLMFLALDGALGEHLVEAWVGPIEAVTAAGSDHRHGVDELNRQCRAALSLHELDAALDPLDRWWTYQRREAGDGDVLARADVLTGSTCHTSLIRDLHDPEAEDELAGSGACFAYVMFPTEELTEGEEVAQRGQAEDRLGAPLRESGVGDVIGGATGRQYTYVDLILFDEPAARDVLGDALAALPFVRRAGLRFFAPGRRTEHVALLSSS